MPVVREVVDGVFELSLAVVNVHLVVTDDGLVLVDTGLPRQAPVIERALRGVRRSLGEVRAILLTHHHPDHAGSAADLRARTGATLVAHAAEAFHVAGSEQAPEPAGRLRGFLFRRLGKVPPTKVDKLVGDGAEPVPGFTALHTPGHTRGHLSFLLDRAGGVLFAGDAATVRDGRVTGPPVVADPERAAASLARLAGCDFEHAVFGHGKPISGRAAARFREATD
ncbi:MBL fold metallo-hydrolase [Actinoplanes oblitus]|uniref:MBL fold metallo-hydrolase n=1 Tax=Actinoplanes oblitus TaxID=3040509 RepID=A0ABY8WBE0_9ACTN|nr:MBL fold metallo-hydrolase [Actinoplanes oblitus]WIM94792.1 MBL fold metallo-hydrolase [Actinoplanes oblitus]